MSHSSRYLANEVSAGEMLCGEETFRPLVMVNLLVIIDNTAPAKNVWTESWRRSCGVLE